MIGVHVKDQLYVAGADELLIIFPYLYCNPCINTKTLPPELIDTACLHYGNRFKRHAYSYKQVAQLSQRNRAAGWVRSGQT